MCVHISRIVLLQSISRFKLSSDVFGWWTELGAICTQHVPLDHQDAALSLPFLQCLN